MPDTDATGPRKFLRLRNRRPEAPRLRSPSPVSWPAPASPVTDVREIVRANVISDQRAGRYQLKKVRRRWGRRGFDFLVMAAFGNGLGVAFLHGMQPSLLTSILTGCAMLFYTVAIAWVMFLHHDAY